MDLSADFKTYQDRVTSCLVEVTRSATQLSNQDLSFHRSANDKFSKSLDTQNTHLLRLTNKLLKAATSESNIRVPSLSDQDAIEDNWRRIIDVVDDLLEKTDASLDEYTGVLKRLSPAPNEHTAAPPPLAREVQSYRSATSLSWSIVQKPQAFFQRKVNNFDDSPFKPLLKSKPHAAVPLEESIGDGTGGFNHPYAYEIEHYQFPAAVSVISPPVPFNPPENSRAIYVDTEQGVSDMLQELRSAKEIAIDLEHNDKRSYHGIVCLMQISTRDKDWIVDTLKPWRENLQILNEVFTDPSIVKVFHGATMDMIWLQRDLGLYVVGLFDTFHACAALDFPYKSLKYLLARFADFEAQKQYQTADWRVRPLPPELLDYARSDTHYLLYIYDHLRNMLVEGSSPQRDLLGHVLQGSQNEALQVYQKPVYDRESGLGPFGWYNLVSARSVRLSKEQLGVFRALHEWRDRKARDLDEGPFTILPHHVIWSFAETMPTNAHRLYAGLRNVQKHVMDNAPQLIEIIKQAIQDAANGPSLQEVIQQNEAKYGVMARRPRRDPGQVDHRIDGIGATLQQLAQNGEIGSGKVLEPEPDAILDPLATRGTSSILWGDVGASTDEQTPTLHAAAVLALQSVLPIVKPMPVNGSSDVEMPEVEDLRYAKPVVATPQPIRKSFQEPKTNEPFIIKDLGRSHKRKAEEMSLASSAIDAASSPNIDSPQNDQTPSSAVFADARMAKQQRKAEKRAKRAAAAAQEANSSVPTGVSGGVTDLPFDYASAESLLSTSKQSQHTSSTTGTKALPMNPFMKALNTSTGAKKSKYTKELPGRGHTFK